MIKLFAVFFIILGVIFSTAPVLATSPKSPHKIVIEPIGYEVIKPGNYTPEVHAKPGSTIKFKVTITAAADISGGYFKFFVLPKEISSELISLKRDVSLSREFSVNVSKEPADARYSVAVYLSEPLEGGNAVASEGLDIVVGNPKRDSQIDTLLDEIKTLTESVENRKQRMLSAFEQGGFLPGIIIVSFADTVQKIEAVSILKSFGLKMRQSQICGPYEINPDGSRAEVQSKCTITDSWSEAIKVAYVQVPASKEIEFAKKLFDQARIQWIEPSYPISLDAGGIVLSKAERLEKMRLSFQNPPKNSELLKGELRVVFEKTVTKSEADKIVAGFNLKFKQMPKDGYCGGAGGVSGKGREVRIDNKPFLPGDKAGSPEPTVPPRDIRDLENCEMIDNWHENTKTAFVAVPFHEEKTVAEKLFSHAGIYDVSPVFSPFPSGDNVVILGDSGKTSTTVIVLAVALLAGLLGFVIFRVGKR